MARVLADDISLDYVGQDPYATLITTGIHDETGNNNGRLDPGETVDLTCVLKNIGGIDFTDLSTTLYCQDAYISILDETGYFGALAIDSLLENLGDPYVIAASMDAPDGHTAEFNLAVNDGSYYDTLTFFLTIGQYSYLVWNPDPTPDPGMQTDSILTTLGYPGLYTGSLAEYSDLGMFKAIFVCVGIYANNYIISAASPEADALVDYLNDGGCVYLEGGDVWFYDPMYSGGYDFGPLFGISAVLDGTSDMGPVVGETGTFTEGMNFTYAGENSYMDHLNPTGTGFIVFRDGNNYYNCGIASDAGIRRTVGTSFELGGLVDAGETSTRAALLDSIMHFFGIETGIQEYDGQVEPVSCFLSVSPSITSGSVKITYALMGHSGEKKVHIYDATGRR
jgi:hypothetical protein